ncbi:ATP-binding protein [Rhodococcus pyridinivorans]|uniref:AlbA family DNA-binding domain-containing protein n=1 Tax=Rhodococcus pyridinivorans TaxID=103816 RepID=UPI00343A61DE
MTSSDTSWPPRTEADLLLALNNGLLEETHYLDLKRELSPGKSGSKGIAKDIAAFAIDGGVILVGVDEGDDPTQRPSLSPQPLEGMAERVEQIGRASISDPVQVQTTAIPSTDDASKGYLVVRIDPSPRAPHMVDGRYYGRGDKTNLTLSNDEVMRYHQKQLADRSDLQAEARNLLDGIDPAIALIALIAEPIGLRDDLLVDLTANQNWENQVSGLLAVADNRSNSPDYPPYTRASGFQRRAEAVAVTQGMFNSIREFSGNGDCTELVFHESGRLSLVSERAAEPFGQNSAGRPADKRIFEEMILAKTTILAGVAAETARETKFYGSWRFALFVRGLENGTSGILADDVRAFTGSRYTSDTYAKETEVTFKELSTDPHSVTRALTMPLLRSLGVHTHPRTKWISEVTK